MRVLITGAAGFAASHLAVLARDRADVVFGLTRGGPVPDGVIPLPGDVASAEVVSSAMRQAGPDFVFHLAALTPANSPESTPENGLLTNPRLTLHLLEAVRTVRPEARVLLVSSSAVYGHVGAGDLPIGETAPLQPTTLYGVGKGTVELLGIHYAEEHGLDVRRARPFNLVGPGEPRAMLTSTLAAQVVEIKARVREPVVRIRHRATARDYTDVRDAVAAYWSILERGAPNGVYNVCSGVAVPIGRLVERLLAAAGVDATVEETDRHPRPGDVRTQEGDNGKLTAATGWRPALDLDRSLADLLRSMACRS